MRNPTGLSPRAIRVQRLRRLFQQRPPRIEQEQKRREDVDAASPPLSDIVQIAPLAKAI